MSIPALLNVFGPVLLGWSIGFDRLEGIFGVTMALLAILATGLLAVAHAVQQGGVRSTKVSAMGRH